MLLILIITILLTTLSTIIGKFWKVSKSKIEYNQTASYFYFFIVALAVVTQIIFAIIAYIDQANKPYEISMDDIEIDLVIDRAYYGAPNEKEILQNLPVSFSARNASIGGFPINIVFNGTRNINEYVSKRLVSNELVYSSKNFFRTNRSSSEQPKIIKFPYKYIWDLNDLNITVAIPQRIGAFLRGNPEWKARLQISCNGIKISENEAIEGSHIYQPLLFSFQITGIDKKTLKNL